MIYLFFSFPTVASKIACKVQICFYEIKFGFCFNSILESNKSINFNNKISGNIWPLLCLILFVGQKFNAKNYDYTTKYNCEFIIDNESIQTMVAWTLHFQTKITPKATSKQHYFILWHTTLLCIKYHKLLHIYQTAGLWSLWGL